MSTGPTIALSQDSYCWSFSKGVAARLIVQYISEPFFSLARRKAVSGLYKMLHRLSGLLALPYYAAYWISGIPAVAVAIAKLVGIDVSEEQSPHLAWAAKNSTEIVFFGLLVIAILLYQQLRIERKKWHPIFLELGRLKDRFSKIQFGFEKAKNTERLQDFLSTELTVVANSVANLMTHYAGRGPCHVSIKTLSGNGDIQTIARSQNYEKFARYNVDEEMRAFPCDQNTAFNLITTDKKCDFYISNHLLVRRLFFIYQNCHRGWWKEYWATAVVPVTTENKPQDINLQSTYGFICVDNYGGGFDNRVCKLLLANVATRCVDTMLKISERSDDHG